MRILLDENLDWRLKRDLPEHAVESVPLLGWAGTQNGALLRKAVEAGFEVLVTMDGNMVHQQNMASHLIAVAALRAGAASTSEGRDFDFSLGMRAGSPASKPSTAWRMRRGCFSLIPKFCLERPLRPRIFRAGGRLGA